jgi:hypothetical protein
MARILEKSKKSKRSTKSKRKRTLNSWEPDRMAQAMNEFAEGKHSLRQISRAWGIAPSEGGIDHRAYSANARSFSIFPPKTPVSVTWDPLVRRLLAFRTFGMHVLDDCGRLYITPGLAPLKDSLTRPRGYCNSPLCGIQTHYCLKRDKHNVVAYILLRV